MAPRKVMRMPAVLAATGWAKPTLYLKIAEGKFPKGTRLDPTARSVVWFEDEVLSWQGTKATIAADAADEPDGSAASLERIADALEGIEAVLNKITGTVAKAYGGYSFVRVSDIGD